MTSSKLNNRWRDARGSALIVGIYSLFACLLTWPLATHLSTDLLQSGDTPLHYWNCWWVAQALRSGASPWYTTFLFYPHGASLVTHNIPWTNALIWTALEPLTGGTVAYNLSLLITLAASGCATYWLAYRLTGARYAALLAGVIDQAWPYRLSQLGHPNLLATYWIPIFLLFLLAAIERQRWRDAVFCGVAFALAGYTRWQQLIPAALLALILLAWRAPTWLGRGNRPALVRLLLAGIIGAALLFPAALMLYQQQQDDSSAAGLFREEDETLMQADLLAYVTPWSGNPLLGKYTQPLYDRYYQDRQGRRTPAYIGVITLVLAIIGIARKPRAVLPWLTMAIALVGLALGPVLRVNGALHESALMPYRILEPLAIFRLMREPERYNVFLGLPMAIMAAYGLCSQQTGLSSLSPFRIRISTGLLSALVVVEFLLAPIPLSDVTEKPSFFANMAADPDEYAVLDLPFDSQKVKGYMLDQTNHHHPILEGSISRLPANAYQYIDANPWLSKLRQSQEMASTFPDVSRQLGILAQDGIRYVILHKDNVGRDRVFHWRRYLACTPRYEDERLAIYATLPEAGRDYMVTQELAPGVGPITQVVSANCLTPGSPIEIDVAWGTTEPLDRDYDISLSLVDEKNVVVQNERFPLCSNWPSHLWPNNSVAWGYYALTTNPDLAPGRYSVQLDIVDSQSGKPLGSPYIAAAIEAQNTRCDDKLSDDQASSLQASYGNQLLLRAVSIQQQSNATVDVGLYWRSLQRMSTDYKIFVHIFDQTTGVPVAQDDAMPHRWAYPTSLWWPGEEVNDKFAISLQGVAPGQYGVAIGVYDPTTGARLPVNILESRQQISDGRLVLSQTVNIQ